MFKKRFEIREHSGPVFSLTKDEHYIYSASADKYVTRWFSSTGKQDNFAIKCDASVYKINHLNNKKCLVIGTSLGDIHIIDTELKIEIKFIRYHKVPIFEIQFDEATHRMYIGDADGNLSIWSTIDWTLLLNLPFDCGKIRSILILKDQKQLLIGAQDGKIRVLDNQYYNLLFTFESHVGGCLAMVVSELKKKILFSAGKDGYIRAWSLQQYQEVFAIPAHNESIYKLYSDSNFLYSVSRDKTSKMWDVNTLDFVTRIDRKIGGHSHSINDILIINSHPITAGDDKRIICWESCVMN